MRLPRMRAGSEPLSYLGYLLAAILLVLGCSRVLLVATHFGRVGQVDGWGYVFLYGARMDVVTASFALVLPALLLLALPRAAMVRLRFAFAAYMAVVLAVLVALEAVTFDFLDAYDARPNRLLVDGLAGSHEITRMVWIQYAWHAVVAAAAVAVAGWAGWKLASRLLRDPPHWSWVRRAAAGAVLAPLLFLGIRGTLAPRPVNASSACFSNDNFLNQLALNSTYSAVYSLAGVREERPPSALYGKMPEAEIIARVGKYAPAADAGHVPGQIPFVHVQRPRKQLARPRNLVIVLEESFGAEFVGCLGGLPLSPNFDALSKEGLLLTQLYATGTRTVRGIEASTCGFLPTPGSSVVKLGLAQSKFFTIAALLREHGYATHFIYGGEAHFDNMAGFLLGNGVGHAVTEGDFAHPAFRGTWGVSDEDLMSKANDVFAAQGGTPFFALVLSTSNHMPYEFPDGRIELHDAQKNTRNNAVKYADYAIGELFRRAKQEDYYANTVWIVVADHDERTWGSGLIPVDKFHIPGLLLGPELEPGRFDKVASQIDLLPTALDVLGVETTHPMIGRNLFTLPADDPGRAILQFYDNHGFLVGDRLAVHPGSAQPRCFRYIDGKLVRIDDDPELLRDGLAHALLPELLYQKQLYRVPAQ